METDETEILRTIRAAPHDDLPRLVYADWLEENGRAERAEHIRLQIAAETCGDDEPRRAALLRRERQLWRKFAGEWRAELPSSLRQFPFRRGFVLPRDLELTGSQFVCLSSSYLDAAPQWTAKLFIHAGDPLPSVARSANLERLTGLCLHVAGADPDELSALLGSRFLRNLSSLSIEGHPVRFDHVRTVATSHRRSRNFAGWACFAIRFTKRGPTPWPVLLI